MEWRVCRSGVRGRGAGDRRALFLAVFLVGLGAPAYAQDDLDTVVCESRDGEREECATDTAAGVVLLESTGTGACLLGKSWGYDDEGIWVDDGCAGTFGVASAAAPAGQGGDSLAAEPQEEEWQTWGTYTPGEGWLVGRSRYGEVNLSAYGLIRYLNQNDEDETFTDHLGNQRSIDLRNDIFGHRVIIFLNGWLATEKLRYIFFLWTVSSTDQDAIFFDVGYHFHRAFALYGGINGNPGSRSLQGSHPYWLGHDRVMADEFFRPYFTYGIWANGEVAPGLWYAAQIGNNSSALGITASQLDDRMDTGGVSMWWMPTTQEFGPRGAYGDWEFHDELATRIGFSTTTSTESRQLDPNTEGTENTILKLADGVNLFETGSLAPGVTIQEAGYKNLAFDAGMKYKGVFLQAEYYLRWLDDFEADGPLPVEDLFDHGFYVQAAAFPIPKKLELYAITSQIYGDPDAGFDDSSEYVGGLNVYPFGTRNYRWNVQVMDVNRSPVSSNFGYYVGGQDGTTITTAFSVFY